MNQLKEFITYLTNQFKFWFIIKEWEYGLQLRNGKTVRTLNAGFYFKIPLIDYTYYQPKRTQDIGLEQRNFMTKDDQNITVSSCIFYKISNINQFYNGYAEPNSIIANIVSNKMSSLFLENDYKDINQDKFEQEVLKRLKKIQNKGFLFEDFKITTYSKARTYRIIKDNLYSQTKNDLDKQLY